MLDIYTDYLICQNKYATVTGLPELSLDDSIEEKPYTEENEIVCWHCLHMHQYHVKGVNIISFLASYDEVSLPVGYEIVQKKREFCDAKAQQIKRQASVSKNKHFKASPKTMLMRDKFQKRHL